MSDLTLRLRQTAHAEYSEKGVVASDTELLLRFQAALTPVIDAVRQHKELKVEQLRDPVYLLAVLCAVSGIDIGEMLGADVARREFVKMKPAAGEAAPVPDSEGRLVDPVTRRPAAF